MSRSARSASSATSLPRGLLTVALAAATLPLAACTDDDPPAPPDVTSGSYRTYVQTGWRLPHDAGEAMRLGRDLDGDGVVENQAGHVLGSLIGLGLELEPASAGAFATGDVVALHRLRADSLAADATIEWRTFDGVPGAAPRFDGSDRLDVLAASGRLAGEIHGGHAELAGGDVAISLPFFPGQTPLRLPLTAARMTVDVDDAGCTGTIAGAIATRELDGAILPDLAVEMIIHIARHPEHPFTAIALEVFDTNHDGQLAVDEILATSLMRGLFRPDLDTDGDGAADAVSFGLGFDCVAADFTAP